MEHLEDYEPGSVHEYDEIPPGGSLGGPGVDALRWHAPVRPGDRLHLRVTVRSTRPSASKPDRGLLVSYVEMLDEAGETVFSCECVNLVLRRPQTAES